jgi:hypothetical protein
LEVGKNVPFGYAEPLRWATPAVGVDLCDPGLTGTVDHRIRAVSGRSSQEVTEKREQLEMKLEHLSPREKQTLLPVIEEYLD